MEVFGLSSAATVFSLARASLTRVLGLVLINKRPLNNGQQQKASSDRDITGRIIAFYGRVIYGSQVFARQKPPIRFLRVLCARFWTAGTISSWPFREISHSDYVHRRVHFRWLCELEHGDGYATSFSVPRGLTANFESRLIQGLWYKNIRIEYKHLFFYNWSFSQASYLLARVQTSSNHLEKLNLRFPAIIKILVNHLTISSANCPCSTLI